MLKATKLLLCALAIFVSFAVSSQDVTATGTITNDDGAAGSLLFTDLVRAPVNAWVTGYCGDPNSVGPGTITTEVIQYDGTGTQTLCGEDPGLVTISGNVIEVTTSTIEAEFAGAAPGDVFYLHGGTYQGVIYTNGWNFQSQFDNPPAGTASQPIGIIGYPGEDAFLQSVAENNDAATFNLGRSGGTPRSSYYVIANLRIETEVNCVSAGGQSGNDTNPESGAQGTRIVNIDCTITDATSNTMTGLTTFHGDDGKLLGSRFSDPSNRTVWNNNHVVYIQGGSDNVEIAYNTFDNLHVGFVVQIHQDGTGMLYTGLVLHHNEITALPDGSYADMRGFTVSNVNSSSTIEYYNNKVHHQGQSGWGCLTVYSGVVSAHDNECTDSEGGYYTLGAPYGSSRHLTLDNELICPNGGVARVQYQSGSTSADVTETNARTCP